MTRASLTLALLILLTADAALASPRQARIAACDRAASQAERLELSCWRLRHPSRNGARRPSRPRNEETAATAPHRESRASREHQRRKDWLRARDAATALTEP